MNGHLLHMKRYSRTMGGSYIELWHVTSMMPSIETISHSTYSAEAGADMKACRVIANTCPGTRGALFLGGARPTTETSMAAKAKATKGKKTKTPPKAAVKRKARAKTAPKGGYPGEPKFADTDTSHATPAEAAPPPPPAVIPQTVGFDTEEGGDEEEDMPAPQSDPPFYQPLPQAAMPPTPVAQQQPKKIVGIPKAILLRDPQLIYDGAHTKVEKIIGKCTEPVYDRLTGQQVGICDNTREIAPQDAFQVKRCIAHQKMLNHRKIAERRKRARAADREGRERAEEEALNGQEDHAHA